MNPLWTRARQFRNKVLYTSTLHYEWDTSHSTPHIILVNADLRRWLYLKSGVDHSCHFHTCREASRKDSGGLHVSISPPFFRKARIRPLPCSHATFPLTFVSQWRFQDGHDRTSFYFRLDLDLPLGRTPYCSSNL